MSEYSIRPYDSADNAALAVMWNKSDDQWPGTFTGGVPMTEEIVRDWMEKETCLMRLVVANEADNSIVGYGSLWEETGREDTCYVAVLNVHPAHQRRSLARRILTQMVDWATSQGYNRVTIGTWPGNLKSVPLYKKVGFFWVPDTDVFLENYIPTIRQLAVAHQFFERHDWYTTFQRELEQVEDDQRHPATGDMKVFVLRWEEDGEFVEAVVDRQGQALTGLETAQFAAYAIVDESEPAQGIAYPVRWRVVNKRTEPVNVSVLASGETGIKLEHRASFTLGAGEERAVEATFTCAVDAPRLEPRGQGERSTPKIRTTLLIGGDVLELGTGLRYRSAVAVSAEPEFPSLLPGRSKTMYLQLRNQARRPLSGSVSIVPQEGLTTDWMRHEFAIGADGYAGLPLSVACDQAAAIPLCVAVTFADGNRQVTTAPQRIPLLVTPPGGVSAHQSEDDERKIVIENDFSQLVCRPKGGLCLVWSKALQRRNVHLHEEAGPPFDPWDLFEKRYDLALVRGRGWARATLVAKSGRFPGLTIVREVTVTGSPLVQVSYRVVNNGATPHKVQVRPSVRFSDKQSGWIALPRKERLVVERASEFPDTEGDMPQKPEFMGEQWIALSRDGQVTGVVWSEDVVEHEFWWERLYLSFAERTLEPQSAVKVGPFYLYAGPGDWRDVRRAWQRTVNVATDRPQALPEPDHPHVFGLSPAPLVTLDGQVEATLYADSVRKLEMAGRIVVEPPPGWTVDRAELPVGSLASGKPLEGRVHLTATSDRVGAAGGRLCLEATQFDEARPFTVIRLGDAKTLVRVEETQASGQPVWNIANGRCSWTVAPAFHGGLVAWREAGSAVNHLMTAFPDDGEIGWLKPWFGGVRPIITPLEADHGWPGKLHEETFTAALFDTTDERGLPWRGVQVAAALKREGFEGLRAEIAYLTVGGSNTLKMVYRLVDETGVYRRFVLGLLAFCQVDGQHRETVLYGDDFQRKRTPYISYLHVGPWGAAVNPATGRAAVMVGASGRKRIELSDWGVDGGHLFFYNYVVLPPNDNHEMVAYLTLAESLEEAKWYGSLATMISRQP